jgi:acetoin utilization deacetylase AcuC-like enzyme
MQWFFSPHQRAHQGGLEMNRGAMVPCHESPERCDIIASTLIAAGFETPTVPRDQGETAIRALHDGDYVDFLRSAYGEWQASGRDGSALPFTFVGPGMRQDRVGRSIFGRLGHYGFDAGTPIVAGTWDAAYWSAQTALAGANALIQGAHLAFSLCRPPGHHAGRRQYGGYCFLNNAALAAQALRDAGHQRVAVLDVDYHHGNGTQELFWDRDDVFYGSIHADPESDFPYFSGFADEQGTGQGQGATLNIPLAQGTDWATYQTALASQCAAIRAHRASALVLSLGVDTWHGDPISRFSLETANFRNLGQQIGQMNLPILVVMEGGYAVAEVGHNVLETLRGLHG